MRCKHVNWRPCAPEQHHVAQKQCGHDAAERCFGVFQRPSTPRACRPGARLLALFSGEDSRKPRCGPSEDAPRCAGGGVAGAPLSMTNSPTRARSRNSAEAALRCVFTGLARRSSWLQPGDCTSISCGGDIGSMRASGDRTAGDRSAGDMAATPSSATEGVGRACGGALWGGRAVAISRCAVADGGSTGRPGPISG
jgi:hypothetical protein